MSDQVNDRELFSLKKKVASYKEVVSNTRTYRGAWDTTLKGKIEDSLKRFAKGAGLQAKIEEVGDVENLSAVVLSLGQVKSGIYEEVNDAIKRHLIKHNGSLIYQQLFNGKVIVMIQYPFIENIGQPRPPKTIGIYRPEELKEPFLLRHLEEFITEITNWEDFDDDEPNQRIGFNLNFPQHELATGDEETLK
ncbi:MAG: hypothetical protein KJP00_07405 [Bacteroidia bacterium]|nr:hypothetical protein [Bacteroidia bacterium]